MESTRVTRSSPESASATKVSHTGTASSGSTDGHPHDHAPARKAAVQWTVEPGWDWLFDAPDAPNWTALPDDPRAVVVKSNPVRRVWRVDFRPPNGADRSVFVKEWCGGSVRKAIRDRFRGPPARIEWRAGKAAVQRGVPTVRHVACGIGRGRSYLISPAMEGAERLADLWPTLESPRSGPVGRRVDALIAATAALLAFAHRNGFIHGDDHPRNILVVDRAGDRLECLYADLYAARCANRISDEQSAGALAQLNQWFRTRTTGTQRLRFLHAYCRSRCAGDEPAARDMVRRLRPRVTRESHRQAARLWAKRDDRIWRTNAYFARVAVNAGIAAHVVLTLRNRDRFPQPSIANRSAEQWRGELRSAVDCNRPALNVVCGQGFECDGNRLIRLRFENAHRLLHRDVPCRWAVAFLHGRQPRDLVWMDASPASTALGLFLRVSNSTPIDRAHAIAAFGRLIRRMSERGVRINRMSGESFGVVLPGGRVMVERPDDLIVGPPRPPRDLMHNVRAVAAWIRPPSGEMSNQGLRDRMDGDDVENFVRSFAPADWGAIRAVMESALQSPHPDVE